MISYDNKCIIFSSLCGFQAKVAAVSINNSGEENTKSLNFGVFKTFRTTFNNNIINGMLCYKKKQTKLNSVLIKAEA